MKVYVHGEGHLAKITRRFIERRICEPKEADIVWLCEDVEWGEGYLTDYVDDLVRINRSALFLASSQWRVGTIRELELRNPSTHFACCPENFRAVDNYQAYYEQARLIIGIRHIEDMIPLKQLFSAAKKLIFMQIESAEMVKHTVNAYLGMCISFINEIRDICEAAGANIKEVEEGLQTEERVSARAPLYSGEPFGGGHIDRDLNYLREIHRTPLIEAIYESNHSRRR